MKLLSVKQVLHWICSDSLIKWRLKQWCKIGPILLVRLSGFSPDHDPTQEPTSGAFLNLTWIFISFFTCELWLKFSKMFNKTKRKSSKSKTNSDASRKALKNLRVIMRVIVSDLERNDIDEILISTSPSAISRESTYLRKKKSFQLNS